MIERKTLAQRLAERRALQTTTAINGHGTYEVGLSNSKKRDTHSDGNHHPKDKNLLVHLSVLTNNNSSLLSREDVSSNTDDEFMKNLDGEEKFAVKIIEEYLSDDWDTTSTDPLSIYLQEISRFPLLTHKQEIDLAQRKEEGDEEARSKLIQHNLRLVVAVAKHYVGRSDLSFTDLIQEGNIGLMRAVEKYDWRKGFRFSTYGIWWVRQSIKRGMTDIVQTIHVPYHMREKERIMNDVTENLQLKLGRPPTRDEIIAEMGINSETFESIQRAELTKQKTSLSKTVTEDGRELHEFIPTDDLSVEELAADAFEFNIVVEGLQHLTKRERSVIIEHRVKGRTLEEVGKDWGISRERVRQIMNEALGKLRFYVEPGQSASEEVIDAFSTQEDQLNKAAEDKMFNLSDRDKKIITLMSQGFSQKEIGQKLGISHYNVKKQVSKILREFGINNRFELFSIAYKEGILHLDGDSELIEGQEVVFGRPQKESSLAQSDKNLLIEVLKGRSDREIAAEFGISDKKVINRIDLLCERYGARNRSHLLNLLIRRRLITLDELS